jgi:hypothetical protein
MSIRVRQARVTLAFACFTASAVIAQTPVVRTAHLKGRVADAVGGAIVKAEVLVTNTALHAETGDDGRFVLDGMPTGPVEVMVRHIGYAPAKFSLSLGEDELRDIRVLLSPVVAMLDSVSVTAPAEDYSEYGGFDRRKARGFGTFITREDIEHKRPRVFTDLFRSVQGVRLVRLNGAATVISNRFGDTRQCPLRYFIDGTSYPLYDQSIDAMVQVADIAAIEIYPGGASVPPQFAGRESTCGVIAIWTRKGQRRQ